MCDCPAHHALVDCTCFCDHTNDRMTQWKERVRELEVEVARLRAGEDTTPREPGTQLTPGQWIRKFNEATTERRLHAAERVLQVIDQESHCFQMDHEGRLEDLQARLEAAEIELAAWRLARSRLGRWWDWPLVQWWWFRQYKRADRRALARETAEIRARAADEAPPMRIDPTLIDNQEDPKNAEQDRAAARAILRKHVLAKTEPPKPEDYA